MRKLLLFALCLTAFGQQAVRWSATTGDVSLSSAGTSATIQQPATNASQVSFEQALVYCSVACTVTQAANGTAATTTAGTVIPLLPNQLNLTSPVNFFTASNVGAGTAQGGSIHVGAASSVIICLSKACGMSADIQLGTGTGSNYTITISSITGTANITFFLRTI